MYAALFKIYRENVSFFEAEKKKGRLSQRLCEDRHRQEQSGEQWSVQRDDSDLFESYPNEWDLRAVDSFIDEHYDSVEPIKK